MNPFKPAMDKLNDARTSLELMKGADSPSTYRVAFSACISSTRSVTLKLRECGKAIEGYEAWHKDRFEKLLEDELWRFVYDARNDDFHHVNTLLRFPTFISSGFFFGAPGAKSASIEFGERGFVAHLDEGTMAERILSLDKAAQQTWRACFVNPPLTHRGKPIESSDPVYVCGAAIQVAAEFVFDARKGFGDLKRRTQ